MNDEQDANIQVLHMTSADLKSAASSSFQHPLRRANRYSVLLAMGTFGSVRFRFRCPGSVRFRRAVSGFGSVPPRGVRVRFGSRRAVSGFGSVPLSEVRNRSEFGAGLHRVRFGIVRKCPNMPKSIFDSRIGEFDGSLKHGVPSREPYDDTKSTTRSDADGVRDWCSE